MYAKPSQMEPLLPSGVPDLEDLARDIVSRSALLAGRTHPITQKTIIDLLRIINSYYSNLIEGHSTHPVDIEKAMRMDYSKNPAKRDLQKESLAHIQTQNAIESRLQSEPETNVSEFDFLSLIHRTFYAQLPPDFRSVKNEQTGEVLDVVPGKLWDREIKTARHIGPQSSTLTAFLLSNPDRIGAIRLSRPR